MSNNQMDRLERELQRWPGVKYRLEPGGTHSKLCVTYEHRERRVPVSLTRVPSRGVLNKVTELRRILTTMGAERDHQ